MALISLSRFSRSASAIFLFSSLSASTRSLSFAVNNSQVAAACAFASSRLSVIIMLSKILPDLTCQISIPTNPKSENA